MLNRDNLRKLADYLAKLPDNYEAFEMRVFLSNNATTFCGLDAAVEERYARFNGGVDKCGAVACAVGHGPSAGFLVPENLFHDNGRVDWNAYADRFFIDGFEQSGPYDDANIAFEWMFSGAWSDFDNTPGGASKRIYWLLENDVCNIPRNDGDGDYFVPCAAAMELYQ